MTPDVQVACISAIGSVLSTSIGAAAAALIGRRIINQDNLKKDLKEAISDIGFLLLVESEHCEENKLHQGRSNRQTVRNLVRARHPWSGRFTPGRIRGTSEI